MSLRQGVSGRTDLYIDDFYLLVIYSGEKYIGHILVSDCTCTPSFNFEQFVVSEQSHTENSITSQSVSQSSNWLILMCREPQLPLRHNHQQQQTYNVQYAIGQFYDI